MTLKEIFEKALIEGQCQVCKKPYGDIQGVKPYICKECKKNIGIKEYDDYLKWLALHVIRKNRKTIGGKTCTLVLKNSSKCKRTIVEKGTIEPKTFIS